MSTYGPFELCEWMRGLILAELDECARPAITTTYSGVGIVAWDDCCGQLVVSPERIYRTTTFPGETAEPEYCCFGGTIAVPLLATLVRCVPVPDDRGRPPKADALAAAHKAILDDAAVVWQAVSRPAMPNEWERAIVSQSFIGAEGGCISIETRLTVGVEAAQWCTEC